MSKQPLVKTTFRPSRRSRARISTASSSVTISPLVTSSSAGELENNPGLDPWQDLAPSIRDGPVRFPARDATGENFPASRQQATEPPCKALIMRSLSQAVAWHGACSPKRRGGLRMNRFRKIGLLV